VLEQRPSKISKKAIEERPSKIIEETAASFGRLGLTDTTHKRESSGRLEVCLVRTNRSERKLFRLLGRVKEPADLETRIAEAMTKRPAVKEKSGLTHQKRTGQQAELAKNSRFSQVNQLRRLDDSQLEQYSVLELDFKASQPHSRPKTKIIDSMDDVHSAQETQIAAMEQDMEWDYYIEDPLGVESSYDEPPLVVPVESFCYYGIDGEYEYDEYQPPLVDENDVGAKDPFDSDQEIDYPSTDTQSSDDDDAAAGSSDDDDNDGFQHLYDPQDFDDCEEYI